MLNSRTEFIPILVDYFKHIISENKEKWTFTSLNKFSSEKGRNAKLELFFVNRFKEGVRVINKYLVIHKKKFSTILNITEKDFDEKIIKTLYFKRDLPPEEKTDKDLTTRRHIFSEKEKANDFTNFFKKMMLERRYWGPTRLRSLRAGTNDGVIGVSIEKELSKIKNIEDKKEFIKKLLILELGEKEGNKLFKEGILFFDPQGNKRLIIKNKKRSLKELLKVDEVNILILENLKKKYPKKRGYSQILYREYRFYLKLVEYAEKRLGGNIKLKRLLKSELPSYIYQNREKKL